VLVTYHARTAACTSRATKEVQWVCQLKARKLACGSGDNIEILAPGAVNPVTGTSVLIDERALLPG
jgi:hypothetical protein